jgi:hypothetical protein
MCSFTKLLKAFPNDTHRPQSQPKRHLALSTSSLSIASDPAWSGRESMNPSRMRAISPGTARTNPSKEAEAGAQGIQGRHCRHRNFVFHPRLRSARRHLPHRCARHRPDRHESSSRESLCVDTWCDHDVGWHDLQGARGRVRNQQDGSDNYGDHEYKG